MTRAINTAALRDAGGDDHLSVMGGIVQRHEGEAQHWRVNEDGDLEIQCVTHAHQMPVAALLAGMGAGGRGVFFIPDEGTEVLLCCDDGDPEGVVTCVPRASRGGAPAGLAAGKVVIVGDHVTARADFEVHLEAPEVNIDDGTAGAQSLILGVSHNTAVGSFLTALATMTTALQLHVDPLGPYPDPVLGTALMAFQTAIGDLSAALPGMLTTVLAAK